VTATEGFLVDLVFHVLLCFRLFKFVHRRSRFYVLLSFHLTIVDLVVIV